MSVTPQYLLQGAAYALEQCGLLLRDANILYRSSAYANAVVLTAFAREELGRYGILLDLRRRVAVGETFTIAQVREACENHVAKQRAGMLSITITADQESGLGKVLRAKMENHPQSPEWQDSDAKLERITEKIKKRAPRERHEKRIEALYVEPVSESQWNRPAAISASAAHDFLQDAVNDYAGRYDQGYITASDSMLRHCDLELYNALEQWSDRPNLQPPESPPPAGFRRDQADLEKSTPCWIRSFFYWARDLGRALSNRVATICKAIFRCSRAHEKNGS